MKHVGSRIQTENSTKSVKIADVNVLRKTGNPVPKLK